MDKIVPGDGTEETGAAMVEIARRTFTKLAGATVAGAAIPAGAAVLPPGANTIRLQDGSLHPVSPGWYERNVVKAITIGIDDEEVAVLWNARALRRGEAVPSRSLY